MEATAEPEHRQCGEGSPDTWKRRNQENNGEIGSVRSVYVNQQNVVRSVHVRLRMLAIVTMAVVTMTTPKKMLEERNSTKMTECLDSKFGKRVSLTTSFAFYPFFIR